MRAVRGKILLVDDEDAIVLGLMRVLYQDNELYDVLLAKSAEVAQQILRENRVDVMVIDVRLPGMSGLDLLCWASTESPSTRAVVMTSYDIADTQEKAYGLGCLHTVQKPFDLHMMRNMILSALDSQGSFSGSLAELSPADVIQMLCLGRKTTAMRVVQGADSGLVSIREGEVVHATWNELSGEAAFFEVLQATGGVFNTLPFPDRTPTTIQKNWQHLLIEGMRLKDEKGRGPGAAGARVARASAEVAAAVSSVSSSFPAVAASPPEAPSRSTAPPDAAASEAPSRRGKSTSGTPPRGVVNRRRVTGTGQSARVARQAGSPSRGAAVPSAKRVAALVDEGFNAMRAGDVDLARARWEEAQRLDPENRMLALNLRRLDSIGQRSGR